MTPEQYQVLRAGDIVEFNGPGCYWVARLTKQSGEDRHWKAINHGGREFSVSLAKNHSDPAFCLVGHSDTVL